jgi:hypothetical protein
VKRIILLIVLIALIAGGVYYFFKPLDQRLTKQDKEQALTKLLGRKVDLSNKGPQKDREYKDKYIKFAYSGVASIYDYQDPSFASGSGLLASFSYDLRNPRVVFNYAAKSKPEYHNVDDDSSYRLRTLPERGYKKSTVHLDNYDATLFTKNEFPTSERSLFMLKDKVAYSFVFTGSDSKYLDTVVSLFSSSFKFEDN